MSMLARASLTDVQDAGPLAEAARRFVEAAEALGAAPAATVVRAWSVPVVFDRMEQIFATGAEPVEPVRRMLEEVAASLDEVRASRLNCLGVSAEAVLPMLDVKETTGEHYGRLFAAFSPDSYWNEPVRLLKDRLERNGVSLEGLERMRVLDAGCGGGRYTGAWRLLGARSVVGLDVSPIGVLNAAARVRRAGLDGVAFHRADVLTLPYADGAFDVVFSNGVLHHTTDWRAGVREAVRVLRRGGLGWLYLIESPGGLFWDVIEILRLALRQDGHEKARGALGQLGLPANRIFYMLDHVMVPINERPTPGQVEASLEAAGATDVQRLTRGASFDRVERIAQKDPYAAVKYGVGENRYVFSKA